MFFADLDIAGEILLQDFTWHKVVFTQDHAGAGWSAIAANSVIILQIKDHDILDR
jgi:hypothetical protein